MLYLVPTPVGNLEDITLRALRVLKEVSCILAEDTRTSRKLLQAYDISTPLQAHHMFNEHETLPMVISRLKRGEDVALITDAGTPAISDPGFLIVRACIKENIPVSCLPGATAFVPALVNSGLPNHRFLFEGFLPHKKGRQAKIDSLKTCNMTMIFYESPFRLLKTLQQFADAFGHQRPASVSREISKVFEENIRGTLAELITHFSSKPIKGEIVIVVAGSDADTVLSDGMDKSSWIGEELF